MGMAASQARFLQLTARLSNDEYEAQQINQARSALADKTAAAATEYQKAINNKRLLFDPDRQVYNDNNNYEVLTYDSIVNSVDEGGLNMRIVDSNGKIVVPALPDGVEAGTAEANKYTIDENVYNSAYLEEGLRNKGWNLQQKNSSNTKVWTSITNSDSLSYDELMDSTKNGGLTLRLVDSSGKIVVSELPLGVTEDSDAAKKYTVDANLKNDDYLDEKLSSNTYTLQKSKTVESNSWSTINWTNVAGIFDVYDTSDDGAAEATYTEKTAQYQAEDKKLELRLKQIESDHSALQTEYDAVKKVIDKNVETTFKTFG